MHKYPVLHLDSASLPYPLDRVILADIDTDRDGYDAARIMELITTRTADSSLVLALDLVELDGDQPVLLVPFVIERLDLDRYPDCVIEAEAKDSQRINQHYTDVEGYQGPELTGTNLFCSIHEQTLWDHRRMPDYHDAAENYEPDPVEQYRLYETNRSIPWIGLCSRRPNARVRFPDFVLFEKDRKRTDRIALVHDQWVIDLVASPRLPSLSPELSPERCSIVIAPDGCRVITKNLGRVYPYLGYPGYSGIPDLNVGVTRIVLYRWN